MGSDGDENQELQRFEKVNSYADLIQYEMFRARYDDHGSTFYV